MCRLSVTLLLLHVVVTYHSTKEQRTSPYLLDLVLSFSPSLAITNGNAYAPSP